MTSRRRRSNPFQKFTLSSGAFAPPLDSSSRLGSNDGAKQCNGRVRPATSRGNHDRTRPPSRRPRTTLNDPMDDSANGFLPSATKGSNRDYQRSSRVAVEPLEEAKTRQGARDAAGINGKTTGFGPPCKSSLRRMKIPHLRDHQASYASWKRKEPDEKAKSSGGNRHGDNSVSKGSATGSEVLKPIRRPLPEAIPEKKDANPLGVYGVGRQQGADKLQGKGTCKNMTPNNASVVDLSHSWEEHSDNDDDDDKVIVVQERIQRDPPGILSEAAERKIPADDSNDDGKDWAGGGSENLMNLSADSPPREEKHKYPVECAGISNSNSSSQSSEACESSRGSRPKTSPTESCKSNSSSSSNRGGSANRESSKAPASRSITSRPSSRVSLIDDGHLAETFTEAKRSKTRDCDGTVTYSTDQNTTNSCTSEQQSPVDSGSTRTIPGAVERSDPGQSSFACSPVGTEQCEESTRRSLENSRSTVTVPVARNGDHLDVASSMEDKGAGTSRVATAPSSSSCGRDSSLSVDTEAATIEVDSPSPKKRPRLVLTSEASDDDSCHQSNDFTVNGSRLRDVVDSIENSGPVAREESPKEASRADNHRAPQIPKAGKRQKFRGLQSVRRGKGKLIMAGATIRTRTARQKHSSCDLSEIGAADDDDSLRKKRDLESLGWGSSSEENLIPARKNRKTNPPNKSQGVDPCSFYGNGLARKRTLRSTNQPKQEECIEILTSDSELEQEDQDEVLQKTYDVVRIAIGTKVFSSECRVAATDTELKLLYRKERGRNSRQGELLEHCFSLNPKDLEGTTHYRVFDDTDEGNECALDGEIEQMSFLALPKNGAKKSKHALVEFRSDNHLVDLVDHMKALKIQVGVLDAAGAKECSRALLDASRSDRQLRLRSIGSPLTRNHDEFTNGRKQSDILVVYPFDGDPEKIEDAAHGLREMRGIEARRHTASTATASLPVVDAGQDSTEDSDDKENIMLNGKKTKRSFFTIQVSDYERLGPEEFLNDTLIDFWMRWMSRNCDLSEVQFFSSLFFTTLSAGGPEAVTKWTKRKGIDVFEKKMLFFVINQSLHWSLCVVVNPGMIEQHTKFSASGFDEESGFDASEPMPFMLFFDSLKAHRKARIAKHIRLWLNSEWTRLNKSAALEPFTNNIMKVYDPRIPYQDNSWDCGVFVCRYSMAMFQLLKQPFSYHDTNVHIRGVPNFSDLITNREEFQFGMPDIIRMREEFATLLRRLSAVFIPWKEAEMRKEKEIKAAEKRDRLQNKSAEANEQESSSLFGICSEDSSAIEVFEGVPSAQRSSTEHGSEEKGTRHGNVGQEKCSIQDVAREIRQQDSVADEATTEDRSTDGGKKMPVATGEPREDSNKTVESCDVQDVAEPDKATNDLDTAVEMHNHDEGAWAADSHPKTPSDGSLVENVESPDSMSMGHGNRPHQCSQVAVSIEPVDKPQQSGRATKPDEQVPKPESLQSEVMDLISTPRKQSRQAEATEDESRNSEEHYQELFDLDMNSVPSGPTEEHV